MIYDIEEEGLLVEEKRKQKNPLKRVLAMNRLDGGKANCSGSDC